MNPRTSRLSEAGVSIWLDDLSRERIESGNLVGLMQTHDVVGVTTNPTIFAQAIGSGSRYGERIAACGARGLSADETVTELTTADVADACDLFTKIFADTDGRNGRVSIEVEPSLARDAAATSARAHELWVRVDRPNAMIKIPGTTEGLAAITDTIAAGISVNVTLIFSIARYREVINAYLLGLERARSAGRDLSKIHSVASFFVSRLDTEVDRRLRDIGTEEALALTGKAAVANARLAYEIFEQSFASERAQLLLSQGAHAQRLLWASTGVKDPSLPDTLYVTELVAPGVVNTMPQLTLEAFADHGDVQGDRITGGYREADQVLNSIDALGIEYREVTELLEAEGLQKFDTSWSELVELVRRSLGNQG